MDNEKFSHIILHLKIDKRVKMVVDKLKVGVVSIRSTNFLGQKMQTNSSLSTRLYGSLNLQNM